jgi:hypothetical protein
MSNYRESLIIILILVNLVFLSSFAKAYKPIDKQNIDDTVDGSTLLSFVHSRLDGLLDLEMGIFYTVTSSGGSDAFHIQIPLLLRILKSTGICFLLLVIYSSLDAETIIADRSGSIIEQVNGPHMLLFHGFGIFGYNGSVFNGPLWLVAVSIRPPRIVY